VAGRIYPVNINCLAISGWTHKKVVGQTFSGDCLGTVFAQQLLAASIVSREAAMVIRFMIAPLPRVKQRGSRDFLTAIYSTETAAT